VKTKKPRRADEAIGLIGDALVFARCDVPELCDDICTCGASALKARVDAFLARGKGG
jgi:hypothetical protein